MWKQEKIKTPLLIGAPINQSEAYIAANKNLPSALAEKHCGAVASMYADSSIQKIVSSYAK